MNEMAIGKFLIHRSDLLGTLSRSMDSSSRHSSGLNQMDLELR